MTKILKRVNPSETNTFYYDGTYINFELPKSIIDLHSLKMYFEAYIDPVYLNDQGDYLKRFLPSNSSCVIDELEIYENNQLVQHIREYNLLHQMYRDLDDDWCNNSECEKVDALYFHFIGDGNGVENREEDFKPDNELITYKYCINNWLGLLNSPDRFLDCSNRTIKIRIKLAPVYIAYRGCTPYNQTDVIVSTYSDPHYKLSNVYMNMYILKKGSVNVKDKIIYHDVKHFQGMKNTSNKTSIISGKVNHGIKYILGTFTDLNRETDTGLQLEHHNEDTSIFDTKFYDTSSYSTTDIRNGRISSLNSSYELLKAMKKPNLLNNSIYFKRNGKNIKSSQFRINGVEVSPTMSLLECFNHIKDMFNSQFKKVITLSSFTNDFFMTGLDYQSQDDTTNNVEWIINQDSATFDEGGKGHLFIIYENEL